MTSGKEHSLSGSISVEALLATPSTALVTWQYQYALGSGSELSHEACGSEVAVRVERMQHPDSEYPLEECASIF
jgi:hypothetical protein